MNNRITQIFKQRYLSDLQTAFIVFWVLDLLEGIDSGFQSDWFFYATIFTSVATALLLAIYATQKVRNDKLNEKITPWVEVTEPTGYIKTKKTLARWKVTYYLSLYVLMPVICFYLHFQGGQYEELLYLIVTTLSMIWIITGFVLIFNTEDDTIV